MKELGKRTKDSEKPAKQAEEMEQNRSNLQGQGYAALGAKEMVENLTTKCLDLAPTKSSRPPRSRGRYEAGGQVLPLQPANASQRSLPSVQDPQGPGGRY